MSSRRRIIALGVGVLLLAGVDVGAQSATSRSRRPGLLEALHSTYPADHRGVRPEPNDVLGGGRYCGDFARPDSLFIVTHGEPLRKRMFLQTWQRPTGDALRVELELQKLAPRLDGKNDPLGTLRFTPWSFLDDFDAVPDTTAFALRDGFCDRSSSDPLALVIERDGYLLFMGPSALELSFDRAPPSASSLPYRVFARGPSGRLEPAVWQRVLEPDVPRSSRLVAWGVLTADSVAAVERRIASIRAKGWSAARTRAVIDGKVAIGMTAEMVRLAWGRPSKINSTITASRRSEQWVYGDQYVYLVNGIVTTMQTSR